MSSEEVAVEGGDVKVAGRLEQSQRFGLSIAGGQPETLVAELPSTRLEFLQQPASDSTASCGLVEEDTSDFGRLAVEGLETAAAHRPPIDGDDEPRASRGCELERIGPL